VRKEWAEHCLAQAATKSTHITYKATTSSSTYSAPGRRLEMRKVVEDVENLQKFQIADCRAQTDISASLCARSCIERFLLRRFLQQEEYVTYMELQQRCTRERYAAMQMDTLSDLWSTCRTWSCSTRQQRCTLERYAAMQMDTLFDLWSTWSTGCTWSCSTQQQLCTQERYDAMQMDALSETWGTWST
jgi:hypothetical protein